MRDVYSNSTFCIAATAARNGCDGLFYERREYSQFVVRVKKDNKLRYRRSKFLPPDIYWCSIHPVDAKHAVESAPLNQRAWVAQERYLSPRILHFAREGLFWECQESLTCESHPDIQSHCCGWRGENGWSLKQLMNKIRFGEVERAQRGTFGLRLIDEAWYDFISFYTRCGMTKESDVFFALRGIALDVCEVFDDELIFGLRRRELYRDLNWCCPHSGKRLKNRPASWRAPSWSWASSTRDISHPAVHSPVQLAKILNMPKETNDASDWQLHAVFVRCSLLSIRIKLKRGKRGYFKSYINFDDDEYMAKNFFDAENDTSIDDTRVANGMVRRTWHGYFLILEHSTDQERYERREYERCALQGLLICPDPRQTSYYQRIGHMQLNQRVRPPPPQVTALDVLRLHKTLEQQEIRLV